MLLRTRVTLIVAVTYSVLAGGLIFAGLKNQELADERYAQATLNGQEIFWQKLVENTVQRLEADAHAIAADAALAEAMTSQDPARVLVAVTPFAEGLNARPSMTRLELISRDGTWLYSSRPLQDAQSLDAASVGSIVDSHNPVRGIGQDSTHTFTATLALPLEGEKEVIGVAVLTADLEPALNEFKAATGSDIFLLDHSGHMAMGTDGGLWQGFDGNLSARKSRMEIREDSGRVYSVVVLPLRDGFGRSIGALVTAREVTANQSRQELIRTIVLGAVVGFLVLVLGLVSLSLRRSLRPLNGAIATLDGLVPSDGAVTLDVTNNTDEIGRMVGAVEMLRENILMLESAHQRRERQRRRQELFLRVQMQDLSDILADTARAAFLADLKPAGDDETGSDAGELDLLGVAFHTLSERIRAQHDSLHGLIVERSREMEVLRESLRSREPLAAPMAPVAAPAVAEEIPQVPTPLVVQIGALKTKPAPHAELAALPASAEAPDHKRLEVTIGNNLDELSRLAVLVDGFVGENALPERISFNLNLCLDELITNIVAYGYDDTDRHEIHLCLSFEDGALMCQIVDDAKEHDPFTAAPEPDFDADLDDRPGCGQGIFLVKEFMDRTEYRRDGNRNMVTLWTRA